MAGRVANKPMQPSEPSRTGRAVRCIALTVLALIVLIGLTVLIIWLVLQPSKMSYTLENLSLSNFNMSKQKINATFVIDMKAKNPNRRISVVYDSIDISVWYDDQTVAFGSISGFVQPRRNTTKLAAIAVADTMPLQSKAWNDMRQQNSSKHELNGVVIRLTSDIHFKIKLWKSKRYVLKVSCWINKLPISSNKGIESTNCDVDV